MVLSIARGVDAADSIYQVIPTAVGRITATSNLGADHPIASWRCANGEKSRLFRMVSFIFMIPAHQWVRCVSLPLVRSGRFLRAFSPTFHEGEGDIRRGW